MDFVVLDKLGYLPFVPAGGQLLFSSSAGSTLRNPLILKTA
jgi:hypothetical protein